MTERWVGRPLLRREDDHILRGDATFVDNRSVAGALHLAFARSPFAHARVGDIRDAAALALPGVAAVVTGARLGGLRPLPVGEVDGAEVIPVGMPLMALDRVRFVGEPVAAVVAESRALAEDAAELVEVEYEPLPPVVELEVALRDDVVLHESAGTNALLRWHRKEGDVEGAFADAASVVHGRFEIPRLAASPIEVRGAFADHDADRDLLTLWVSAQDPHRPKRHLAWVLDRDPGRIRVVVRDVGGAFGSKGALAPEAGVAAAMAMRLGRPVKWVESRSENFLASYQGRGQVIEAELAVNGDGRFLALRARMMADLGAYLYPSTPQVPVSAAMLLTGAYEIPAVDVELVGVATNRVPTGPYRGAGRPEAAFVAERMADLAAAELGMDPVEIRRRNFIPPERFPYRTPLGFTYDSGDYAKALDTLTDLLGYDRLRTEHQAAREAGRLVGIGLAVFVERAGAGLWEAASVEMARDGRVVVRMGSTPHGQGHETTFAQIAADALGVPPETVEMRSGDTADAPEGMGSFASRSVTVGGSAVVEAARAMIEKGCRVAARLLGVALDRVSWSGREFVAAGFPGLSLQRVAEAAHGAGRLPEGMEPGLAATARFTLPGPVFPFGAYAVTLEIDRETGVCTVDRVVAVDDAGSVVNPLLAEGQVTGSIVQGLGQALFEEMAYDEQGQPLTGSFAVYVLPSAPDVPHIESRLTETPSPFNPLGAKGLGESGSIAVPAAVANAVADALSPLGVPHLDPPYTAEKLWRAIRDARAVCIQPRRW